jgi:DNA helicase INO80
VIIEKTVQRSHFLENWKQLVQRKVQKNEPLARDPKEVALEDEEKTFKYWINLVRKDLPKHHKSFLSYFKKLSQDVKRAAELCQREVRPEDGEVV